MKKNIAVVAGGFSSEYVISIKSGKQVLSLIDTNVYNPYFVSITEEEWCVEIEDKKYPINKADFSFTDDNNNVINFDVALNIIHGNPGENGKLQAYFDLLKIPYTTGGVLNSAITFNKFACKAFLKEHGVNTAKAVLLKEGKPYKTSEILRQVGLPCFVKPNSGGSSFGVTKVKEEYNLEEAINVAFKEDREVIIEEFIDGREYSNGVVKFADEEILMPVTEIISKNEFFDYEAKYNPEMADEITPAKLPEVISKNLRNLSSKIYDLLDCRGIVRIDYLFSESQFFFMEVNTIPGMSKESIVPKQLEAMGLNPTEIIHRVIESARFDK